MKTRARAAERTYSIALFALTTAVLLLIMAGVVFAAEPEAAAPPAALSGWFHTIYGDAPQGGGGHLHAHVLVDDKGHATRLAVPDSVIAAAGGRHAINRRRVSLEGHAVSPMPGAVDAGGPLVAVHALSAEAAGAQSVSALGGPEALVSGSQKWVSILCRFADSATVTPFPRSWFETLLMGGQAPGLDHYWRTSSFGTVNLTGSIVLGWYTLPYPRSHYVYGSPLALDSQRAAEDCTAAADPDVYFPSYVGINLMFNQDLDCCAWGGSTTMVLDGVARTYRMTWLPPWGYESQGPIAHEMGHGFGLPHSSGPYNATYDSRWDVMSDVWGNCPPYDATYGCVGTQTISYHKDLLGWIPSARRYVASAGTSQTIALEPLDQLAGSDFMIARIPIPGSNTRFYTVETRRLAGYDAPLPGHAVVIHLVDTTRADRDAQVVDPDRNGDPDDASAMWLPGETFVDPVNNISVAVVGTTTEGFLVTVTTGAPASYTLSFAVSGPGTVTSNPPGIACSGGVCTASFPSGTAVSLTATGGALSSWGGACGLALGSVCTVSMEGDRSASAAFAAAAPDITVSPTLQLYGLVAVGGKSGKIVTVRNDGAGTLVLGTATLAGLDPGQWKLPAAVDLCSGRALGPGESCTLIARFKPTSAGSKSAKLKITSNDSDEPAVKVLLSGTGASPALSRLLGLSR